MPVATLDHPYVRFFHRSSNDAVCRDVSANRGDRTYLEMSIPTPFQNLFDIWPANLTKIASNAHQTKVPCRR